MNLKDTFTSLPAMQDRQRIPKHKRRGQVWMTLLGLGIIAATIFVKAKLLPDMPWLGVLGGAFAGGFVASKQFMLDMVKAFAQMVASIVGALAGKKDDGGWASLPLVAGVVIAGGAAVAFLQSPSAAGEFSLGVTIGILLGEALAMLAMPYVIKRFGMSFGAYTDAQQASTAAVVELTKVIQAIGEVTAIRLLDEQRKNKEVA